MNLLDVLILLALGFSIWVGYRRGAAMQMVAYSALLIGLVVGAVLGPELAGFASDPFTQATIALVSLLAFAAIFDAVGWTLGTRLWAAARRRGLGTPDAYAGSLVGAVATLLAVWFLAFNLVQGPFPVVSRQIRGSGIVRGIDAVLPRPPSILAQVRGFLDRFGFPEVFAELPPAPAGPVGGPSEGEVGRAIQAADQSTLRIVGRACDRIQEGSGFLVAPRYVVTNAHVVAGVDRPEVQQQGGGSFRARTVLFNSRKDVAVLRLGSSPADALAVLERNLSRGAGGAVLGYPGGGALRGEPAGVRRVLNAVGRDIYGRRTVEREVYELQARVRPGNSGGPFVSIDGRVAGVIFAASTTNEDVGYALTSTEAMPIIRRGIGRREGTDTGPCIR